MTSFEMRTDGDGITVGASFCLVGSESDELALRLAPNTRYAVQMTPIPDGYRLATEEDRKGRKPAETMYWQGSFWEKPGKVHLWSPDSIYIVPLTPETVEVQVLGKKKTITLAQAKSLGLVD